MAPQTRIPDTSYEHTLRAALAAEPDLAGAIAKLTGLVETFNSIKAKADDSEAVRVAAQRELDARDEVARLVTLAEIGRASPETVEAAREALRVAVDGLEAVPRRRDVLLGELRTVKAEIAAGIDVLTGQMKGWEAELRRAIDAAEVHAIELLRVAAFADNRLGQYPYAPDSRHQLAGWIGNRTAELPDPAPVAAVPVIEAARSILREAGYIRSDPLPAPKPRPALPGHHFHEQHHGPASDPQPVPASIAPRSAAPLW